MTEQTKIPHEHFTSELKKIGRDFMDAISLGSSWIEGEFHVSLIWPDGHTAVIGFGPEASAVIEQQARLHVQH